MEEQDVIILQRYIDYNPKPVDSRSNKEHFETLSYSNWAANEILYRVREELFKPPPYVGGQYSIDMIDLVNEFAFDMRSYYEKAEDEKRRKVFEVAERTADDFLRFYVKERRKECRM